MAGKVYCTDDSSHGAQSTGEDRHQTFITNARSVEEGDVVCVERHEAQPYLRDSDLL